MKSTFQLLDEAGTELGSRFYFYLKLFIVPGFLFFLTLVLPYVSEVYSSPLLDSFVSIAVVVQILFSILYTLGIIYSLEHKELTVRQVYAEARKRAGLFLVLAVLQIAIVITGLILFILPGIWLAIATMFAAFVFILRTDTLSTAKIFEALAKSRSLVKGRWWSVFGKVLLSAFLLQIIFAIVEVPIFVLEYLGYHLFAVILSVLISLCILFVSTIQTIFFYFLFVELETTKKNSPSVATTTDTGRQDLGLGA